MEPGTQATAAAAIVLVMEWLKYAKWFPWLQSEHSGKYKRAFAFTLATATAIGFHYAIDYGARTLTLTWPTAEQAAHGLMDWLGTAGFAHVQYALLKLSKTPVIPPPVS